ncbi:unnamed protein product [Adineta steineri]|uniref:Uncharacterized protein n=1 Tax=Adineta steineri TaxID=433720 RepID=A0A815ITX6_9BILA|nr:unnamed protein product [Adineta steineri]CAF1371803.1 unnamed protein product [Adineta steineri]CAF1372817.1 unnamed protein product [Adineta steineri]
MDKSDLAKQDLEIAHNMPHIFRIQENTVSIRRLRAALAMINAKYGKFHTATNMSNTTSNEQLLLSENDDRVLFKLSIISEDDKIQMILNKQTNKQASFDFGQGRLFYCHAIKRSLNCDEDLLITNDIIIFNFDDNLFDNDTLDMFYYDIDLVYSTGHVSSTEFEERYNMQSE